MDIQKNRRLIDTVLSQTALFKGVAMPHDKIRCCNVEKGQRITHVDGDAIVCILKGRVDVYTMSLDGNDVYLSSSRRGDCFGVSNLFASNALQTRLIAKTNTLLVYIPRQVFVQLMQQYPFLSVRYATICNQKIQFLLDRIAHLTIQSARQKVAVFLYKRNDSENPIPLAPREKLASYLGVSRATLFRELAFFKENGMVCLEGNTLKIINEARLKTYCM